jgi:hypothetical protein
MNVEIGTEAPIFLFWEYLFQIFGILSLQCGVQQAKEASRLGMKERTPYANSCVYHMLVQVKRMEGRARVIVSYIICFGWCVSVPGSVKFTSLGREGGDPTRMLGGRSP